MLGHKHPMMLVCFLACVKAGHAYVPVDNSLPTGRIRDIIGESGAPLVLAPQPMDELELGLPSWSMDELLRRSGEQSDSPLDPSSWVQPQDPYYVIFTSGSTGKPKGVQISRDALNRFTTWALSLRSAEGVTTGPDAEATYLNQAPFSFDLSVFDMAMALGSGATLYSVDKAQIAKPSELVDALRASGVTVWVSTPSFADLCLMNPEFTAEVLPGLELMLFCGETLTHDTASQLRARFPRATVVNTYGPTESTVAVTSVVVTDDVLDAHAVLPIGAAKPGTTIHIQDADGTDLSTGASGEIVIAGDTVSLGYFRRPDLTAKAFTTIDGQPAYRTGDAGSLDEDGQLHFGGRLDFQVKLHGYRIELEDIEANLRGLPSVGQAVVLPMHEGDDPGAQVTHLQAVVQLHERGDASNLGLMVALKKQLRELLPDYMVPKNFTFVDAIPLTANGKVDRAAVRATVTKTAR